MGPGRVRRCNEPALGQQGVKPAQEQAAERPTNVRFGSKADMCTTPADVRFGPIADIVYAIFGCFDDKAKKRFFVA